MCGCNVLPQHERSICHRFVQQEYASLNADNFERFMHVYDKYVKFCRSRCGDDEREFRDVVTYYKDDDDVDAVCQAAATRSAGNGYR